VSVFQTRSRLGRYGSGYDQLTGHGKLRNAGARPGQRRQKVAVPIFETVMQAGLAILCVRRTAVGPPSARGAARQLDVVPINYYTGRSGRPPQTLAPLTSNCGSMEPVQSHDNQYAWCRAAEAEGRPARYSQGGGL